mgnify:CR=1 FL=1
MHHFVHLYVIVYLTHPNHRERRLFYRTARRSLYTTRWWVDSSQWPETTVLYRTLCGRLEVDVQCISALQTCCLSERLSLLTSACHSASHSRQYLHKEKGRVKWYTAAIHFTALNANTSPCKLTIHTELQLDLIDFFTADCDCTMGLNWVLYICM